jgi:RNA-directed DNA polymerase
MLAHSKGENQKTTKLDRIGKLAATQKDIVFNNIGHVIDLELLRECYRQLDGNKAVGIDGVTKEAYGKKLEENLQNLLAKVRRGAYKPQAARVVEIPKEDGSTRPLAISCFEDKIIQMSATIILNLIYEPLFLPSSYGYREGISPHNALRALMAYSNQNTNGATVEIDLRKYFNSIPHSVLMEILEKKISDKRFLKLIETLIRTPTMAEGEAIINTRGCPQGSIISAILSNVYLHYVIDDWFERIKKTHMSGRAEEVRFCDDMVFVFQNKMDAERFYKALPKRLEKFGLEMHEGKSSIIPSGRIAAEETHESGKRLPTYKFLGFVCYWGQSRNGKWRLKYKSRPDRMHAKLNGLRKYLKENLNQRTQTVMRQVNRVIKGWMNYYAISDNERRVYSFVITCKHALFRWRNRKGGQRKLNWKQFSELLKATKFPENIKTTSMFASSLNRA